MACLFKKGEKMKKKFRSFEDARKFAQSLKLKSSNEWKEYCKSGQRPNDIPYKPQEVYKNKGWIGWGDFLGTGITASQNIQYISFTAARKYVHALELKNINEWRQYTKSGNKPLNIPANPYQTYAKKGWKGIPDWLGNGNLSNINRTYLTFEKCKKFIQKLEIMKQKDWERYCKSDSRPDNIPTHPERIFKQNWKGWGDFLGTGRIANQDKTFLSKSDAQKIVQELAKKYKIRTIYDWKTAVKEGLIPDSIPKAPWFVYSKKRIKK